MNRRNFIQTLTAAGISTALPIRLVGDAINSHKCTRRTELHDYDSTRVLFVRAEIGGRRHSLRKLIKETDWCDMTGAQREATWRRLEMLALELAATRAAA
jgi:hypothetical protein